MRELSQSELEQINAYLDGELEAEEASRVEAMIGSDPAWAQGARELRSLDSLLGEYEVEAAPAGLADRIIAASRRERSGTRLVIRLARYLTPVTAAAAAVVLYVSFYQPAQNNSDDGAGRISQREQQDVDNVIVEHLGFFKQYEAVDKISQTDTVADEETLKALDQLESHGT